ncbi:MAG: hypothetical protein RL095_537 [Verrucomicrobiota bacterium]|jgi:hypothetical protein
MKDQLKSPSSETRLLIAGLLVLVAVVLLFPIFAPGLLCRMVKSERCKECRAERKSEQRVIFGFRGDYVVTTLAQDQVAKDFLPPTHRHQWVYSHESSRDLIYNRNGFCSIGSGRHVSELFRRYVDPRDPFRTAVMAKIQAGQWPADSVRRILIHDRSLLPAELTALAAEMGELPSD